jgi:ribosomal protein L32
MEPIVSGATDESCSAASGLAWRKRATVVVGATHRRRTWESRCGWYRIVHSCCLYGPRKGRQAIPDAWYATKLVVESGGVCWEVISRHRQRGPAVRACEKDVLKKRDKTQVCNRCGERPPSHFGVRTLFGGNTRLCERCWNLYRRRPRSRGIPSARHRSLAGRKLPLSPDQMSFAFIHKSAD